MVVGTFRLQDDLLEERTKCYFHEFLSYMITILE